MKPTMTEPSLEKNIKIFSLIALIATSIITWYVSYRSGLAIIYNDAMSHLNIARAVIDGRQPGLAQLGSVWLPLNHILFLLLIWNTWAWHSGFAGSFFSMLAYIFSAIGIYKIVKELTLSFGAAILGAIAFALNPNILYLQTTPLTEPLYLVFFIFSVLFIIKFIKTNELNYLMLMGGFGMLQVLTRYDGWFVIGVEGLILTYQQLLVVKVKFQEFLGKFLIFSIPIIFGISLWLLWNALIFGSPLYFAFGPYSAHAQQLVIQNSTGLITKGHLSESILAYWYAARDNVGVYSILLSSLGVILFFGLKGKIDNFKIKSLILFMVIAPILFNIIALYLGFSILNLPELHWDPSGDPSQQWFNVRYGIMALPAVAIFIGLLAEKLKKKILLVLVFLALIAQSLLMYQQGIITITDGTMGTSHSDDYAKTAAILAQDVTPSQNILISTASYSSVIFRSGFPMKDFITEGDSSEWKTALANPASLADWVVMGNDDPNDGVYAGVFENNSKEFLKNYIEAYCNISICVYEKRTPAETFVSTDNTNLKVGNSNFTVRGVNSYDLAYQSTSTIDATFKNLSSIGVNTVRFWLFGDGNPDGFQPTSGITNEARFETADYVIADAANYNIRLIPVLANNWTDYGGEQQYLKWTGQNQNDQDLFYTNPETIALFENYINHVVPRTNTVNGIPYYNDPTIMAWEIVNEPRFSSSDTTAFVNWFSQVASYIRQEDPNHLITNETAQTSVSKTGQISINNYCNLLPVDFCTAHLYLYNNTTPIYNSLDLVKSNIDQYIQLADSDDKPFLLGEIGVSKATQPFGEQPLDVLKNIMSFNNGDSGALIWNWSQASDTSYGFSPTGVNEVYTLSDLSTVLGGIQPSTIYIARNTNPTSGYNLSVPGQASTSTNDEAAATTIAVAPSPAPKSKPTPVSTPTPTPVATTTTAITRTTSSSPPTTQTETPLTAPTPSPKLSLPYSTNYFDSTDWGDGWGALTSASATLIVGSGAGNTSGGIFLNNSNSWQDYLVTANINWVKGQLFTLIARRSDSNDYLQCVFSYNDNQSEQIDINRISDNQTESLMSNPATISNTVNNIKTNDMEVTMQVKGQNVQCGINNAFVSNDLNLGLPPALLSGGIGFTTWDPTPNNSEIIINNISVTYPQS